MGFVAADLADLQHFYDVKCTHHGSVQAKYGLQTPPPRLLSFRLWTSPSKTQSERIELFIAGPLAAWPQLLGPAAFFL